MRQRLQARVARRDLGVQVAIGVVQVPIAVFQVRDQIAQTDLEFSRADVVVDAGDDDAVDVAGRRLGSSDAIKRHTAALQQGLAKLAFEVHVVIAVKQVGRSIVRIVIDVVPDGERGARGRGLRHFADKIVQVLFEEERAAAGEQVVERAVVLVGKQLRRHLRVKGRQGPFHAQPRIAGLYGRVVNRLRQIGPAKHVATQVAQHLGVFQPQPHRVGQRQVPRRRRRRFVDQQRGRRRQRQETGRLRVVRRSTEDVATVR